MKEQLRLAIIAALKECYEAETLSSGHLPEEVQLEVPKNPEHGDFATNLAMTMAKLERKAPRQIAEALVAALQQNELCEQVEIAGPGFINFRLRAGCWYDVLDDVMTRGLSLVAVLLAGDQSPG